MGEESMGVINIQLETTRFEPGGKLAGEAVIASPPSGAESVAVSLLWFTAGKGTEDVEVVEETHHPLPTGHVPIRFHLPEFPWSFSGKLVSLVWAVEVRFEPKGAVDRMEIVVAPGQEEIRLDALDHGTAPR